MTIVTSAARKLSINVVAKANSPVFSTLYAEVNALLKSSGKKSSYVFGVAIEAFHARRQVGLLNRFTKSHKGRNHKQVSYSYDISALLSVSEERAAENTHLHNLKRNELTKKEKPVKGSGKPANWSK